ncbi:hypothetical protein A33Q_1496 [Indibacter alkaliphilus LW1]|jgi:hypothetical protein|uniref:Outer membrane protein beta-barrel domain-containing protein n=1 Tax=Indibacter alkaliphilus (strain CCUG 57479 / KCTC 22604 / LW1) TaxID=1189612 RepID=S2DGT1_INDAL|nr:hypothetical protein [Indibacter alkaliphilus]EOZ98134.1 hypothetical protein A33Q_1496 [Indibacter alkaliphilus LW1]
MVQKQIFRIALIVLFLFPVVTHVQAQAFKEKDLVLNAGLGLGSTYAAGLWGGGFGLPIGVGAEYGVASLEKGVIGVAGEFGYVGYNFYSLTTFGVRGSFHFAELLELEKDNLDLYGGLGLYYRNFNFEGTAFATGGAFLSFHAGARYYLSEKFGVYGEIGNTWAWLNLGVVFKIN